MGDGWFYVLVGIFMGLFLFSVIPLSPAQTLNGTVVSATCAPDGWFSSRESVVIVNVSGPMRAFNVHQTTCLLFAAHLGSNVTVGTWAGSRDLSSYSFPDGTSFQ